MRAHLTRILTAATLVAATLGVPGGCAPKACGVALRGLEAVEGQVVDVLTVRCDPPPQSHLLQYWIEYRGVGDEFDRLTPRAVSDYEIPKPSYTRTVAAPCVKGYYRTHYSATGHGPDGIPFDFESAGRVRFFDTDDCQG